MSIFQDTLNRINVWGCLIVFLGVITYKVQFHYSKKRVKQEDQPEVGPSTSGRSQQKYRQIKDHFSDDEGDLDEFDHTHDDLDCFLEEDNALFTMEVEMPRTPSTDM